MIELLEIFYNKITNPQLIQNLTRVSEGFLVAFLVAFVISPLIDRIAHKIGAVDKPKSLRDPSDKTASRRIHEGIISNLGGLGTALAIILAILILGESGYITKGIALGFTIVVVFGLIDTLWEMSAKFQLFGQFLVAFILVFAGNTIKEVDFGFWVINLNWYSDLVFNIAGYTYNFIFPADLITMVWVIGLMNAINWVGGVDGLNGAVSSLAGFTFLLIVLDRNNPDIALASLIAIYVGGTLGVLPYNWYPQKMMYGSIGDYLNGYLLAVFAIFSSTKWVATIIILGLPILDALLVVALRFKEHKEVRRNPLKILSISDKNHLHHRLLASGYSKKMVVLIEVMMMMILCTIAFWFSGVEREYFAMFASLTLIVVAFTVVAFLKKRNDVRNKLHLLTQKEDPLLNKEVQVNIITDVDSEDSDEEEKFIY
ncbi:MAG: undecaprenyl-phosphate alpha-N-acetylglucosaminyl 1-phosphate transferase [Candidatus Dojkabacteria bacterium]|nr:MAG: undecaprenyl-phosphate alpha-N-acetylglucosaminyl 1-phosphate transferase [Candidatus Dojkabacteria bacterium]